MFARPHLRNASRLIRSSQETFPIKSSYLSRAYLHGSSVAHSIYPLRMPALSPTMESGQISHWNVKAGEQFSAGDVLLTVETDKAEVDVEAQDDGYMGPQLFGPGSSASTKTVNVGELIAVLGEQAEDVQGSVDIPAEWNSQSSSSSSPPDQIVAGKTTPSQAQQPQTPGAAPQGHHLKTHLPLSPSVNRLLKVLGIQDVTKIKGTGLHGRLTKGDVLAHLKQASSPSGTALKMIQADAEARLAERFQLGLSCAPKLVEQEAPPLDGPALRQFITEGLSNLTHRPSATGLTDLSFDSILDEYCSLSSTDKTHKPASPVSLLPPSGDKYFEGLDRL